MATREEIREGIRPFFCYICEPADVGCTEYDGHCSLVDGALPKLLEYLHSQGVVLKVERELPLCPWQPADDGRIEHNFTNREAWIKCRDQILKIGYSATEPLI